VRASRAIRVALPATALLVATHPTIVILAAPQVTAADSGNHQEVVGGVGGQHWDAVLALESVKRGNARAALR
jgi:hypothetical protein